MWPSERNGSPFFSRTFISFVKRFSWLIFRSLIFVIIIYLVTLFKALFQCSTHKVALLVSFILFILSISCDTCSVCSGKASHTLPSSERCLVELRRCFGFFPLHLFLFSDEWMKWNCMGLTRSAIVLYHYLLSFSVLFI